MNSFGDVGGSDLWLRNLLSGDELYDVYHSTAPKETQLYGAWEFVAVRDWLTYGVHTQGPKAKSEAGKRRRTYY